ncbi:MAG: DUF1553 domain-containing protein [Pirellulaceae bacterium]
MLLQLALNMPALNMPALMLLALMLLALMLLVTPMASADEGAADEGAANEGAVFEQTIAPLLERRCLSCHNEQQRKGDLSLATRTAAEAGGESGPAVVAGKPAESLLLDFVRGDSPEMPKTGQPLTADEVAAIEKWIASGAAWPNQRRLTDRSLADLTWWSLQPLQRPRPPQVEPSLGRQAANVVDLFVLAKLHASGLSPSPTADRRTLIRRVYYDLIGLPPTPEEVEAFESDKDPLAYEKLVDRLLASPRYGERWARHWLDVVHYGDTHGYDKDKLRTNAWPYRDYVIRSLNADKPYPRFVREQLAGDVFFPDTIDGNTALGFIAAGPWDYVGHAEVPESKIDGRIARHLDRDDMVATTMNVFCSTTVQCAQCHNHKFDPVTQRDYYRLHAVFAAVDRADRQYEVSPAVAEQRRVLQQQLQESLQRRDSLDAELAHRAGPELTRLNDRISALEKRKDKPGVRPEFGYHSQIETSPDSEKWVQVDLRSPTAIAAVEYIGCHDTFAGIGAGFGFPVRYRIEASNDPEFGREVQVLADYSERDVANPGVAPQRIEVEAVQARYIRVVATKLASRRNDYIFALAELRVLTPTGENVALGVPVTARDSIEAPVRWRRQNLVDGYYYGVGDGPQENLAQLRQQRERLLDAVDAPKLRASLVATNGSIGQLEREIAELPARQVVYAGAVHSGKGNFLGTGHNGGRPRAIHILHRGDIQQPGELVGPGTIDVIPGADSLFALPKNHHEGARRAALAEWIVDRRNPLTWRSIVNRLWQYHFGRPIAASPNDLGRMGQPPSHPQLLDWLACELRDGEPTFKRLHRLLVTSNTYRQSSADNARHAEIDGENRLLWRMNRRRLEAEEIRDTVLSVSGKLDSAMFGPGFWCFEIDKPEHSPHYEYDRYDADDPRSHRRAIYRFIVRSAPDPFMETLDCADPSQRVARRNETLTPLHALAMMNNQFVVRMAQHFARRLERQAPTSPEEQIALAYRLTLGREPSPAERTALADYTREHGLANACRVVLNLNEFMYID